MASRRAEARRILQVQRNASQATIIKAFMTLRRNKGSGQGERFRQDGKAQLDFQQIKQAYTYLIIESSRQQPASGTNHLSLLPWQNDPTGSKQMDRVRNVLAQIQSRNEKRYDKTLSLAKRALQLESKVRRLQDRTSSLDRAGARTKEQLNSLAGDIAAQHSTLMRDPHFAMLWAERGFELAAMVTDEEDSE